MMTNVVLARLTTQKPNSVVKIKYMILNQGKTWAAAEMVPSSKGMTLSVISVSVNSRLLSTEVGCTILNLLSEL